MPKWEAWKAGIGPVFDPDNKNEEIPLVRDTKKAVIEALKQVYCASKFESRRVCKTCYRIRFLQDFTGEWTMEINVQTVITREE